MVLANPIRLVAITITALALVGRAVPMVALGHPAFQNQQPQTAPAKPSPNVTQPPSLPATQPTSVSDDATDATRPAPPAEHVDVELVDGKVTVDATNASLNKVLHEVAAKAGFKVTGGISDERVFGHYGPSTPAAILALLLDGTGTNMLIVDDANGASELILTQRTGTPTPPNPLAAALETTEDQDGRPTSRYVPPTRPFQPPGPGRGPLGVPQVMGPPPQGNFNGSDPSQYVNDGRSTQQIYEQLQNQQKQNATQSPD